MDEADRRTDRKLALRQGACNGDGGRHVRVRQMVQPAGLTPELLADLSFEQAAELLSQADIGGQISDEQAIELVGFLLASGRGRSSVG